MALTALVAGGLAHTTAQRDEQAFEAAAHAAQDAVMDRVETSIALLRGTAGLFASREAGVTVSSFRDYMNRVALREQYPGILGIGFSQAVAPARRAALEAEMRAQGHAAFRIWPEHEREELHSIVMLEPLDQRNRAALGYDMYTDEVRRKAMARARDLGMASSTGVVELVQEIDERKQPGVLLYLPVYRGGAVPPTVPERRERLLGFAYAPIRAADFLSSAFSHEAAPRVALSVFEGERLLYAHAPADMPSRPRFTRRSSADVAGQPWTFEFHSTASAAQAYLLPALVAAAGLVLSALLALMLWREQRSAEALRRSEARKTASFQTALDCIISIDHRDRVIDFNAAAERTFGFRSEEVLGRELAELIVPPALRERHRQGMARHLASGEAVVLDRRIEMPAVRADGTEFPVELAVTRIPGEPPVFTAYLRDITQRKRAQAALEEAGRRKDEFIATLSHELRNPLAPLRNGLELLRRPGFAAGPEVRAMMQRQVDQLVRLVDDLLEMSRISRGDFDLRRERVEAAGVVRNAIETSEPLIRAARHLVEVSLPPEPLWLDGDPVRLGQIVSNLLNNAARYTDPGGRIAIRARRDGGMAELSVQDSGVGIEPGMIERVFEMFTRSEAGSARSQGGLGIGLALSRRLAEMHGGTLQAASAGPGKGATFTLRLPLHRGPDAAAAERPAKAASIQTRILVVDDNGDAADSLAMVLRMLGAQVEVANSGEQALAAFDQRPPEAVLLDIGMPGMDGYEVARRLRARANGERVPIVALTGWGQEEDRRRAREAGFDHHVVKPAGIDALSALLASIERADVDRTA